MEKLAEGILIFAESADALLETIDKVWAKCRKLLGRNPTHLLVSPNCSFQIPSVPGLKTIETPLPQNHFILGKIEKEVRHENLA